MNTLTLGRTDCVYVYVTLVSVTADGAPTNVATVNVGLLPKNVEPGEAPITWVTRPVTSGKAQVLVAMPSASPADKQAAHVVVPSGGADVYAQVVDNPETLARKVGRIEVE